MKNVYLARGAAEAVTRWTAAVTQLAGFVICCTGALPIWTQFRVAFALSFQKLDDLAIVDACSNHCIDMFHLLVNAKNWIDGKYYCGH